MNKKAVITLMSVVCMAVFCLPVSAAQQYPQKTSSASGDVSAYCTIEYRGYETSDFALNNWDNRSTNVAEFRYAELAAACRIRVSVTLRNRSSKIQVCDLNNFRLSVSGFNLTTSAQTDAFFDFTGIRILDEVGVDVYDISYNNSSNSAMAWTIDFRDRNSLVLEPDEQRDYSFDIYIPLYLDTGSPAPDVYLTLSDVTWSASVWGITQVPSFTGYTIEEYANMQEGWWSYLVRSLQKIVNGNQTPYEEVESAASAVQDDSNDVSDTLDTVHAQEQQWYQQNSTAIESTGLSNYQFTNNQKDGLLVAVTQFSDVWTALGNWNLIYIFTLILSLATFILRHRPTTRAQQRRREADLRRAEVEMRADASHAVRMTRDETYYTTYSTLQRLRQ